MDKDARMEVDGIEPDGLSMRRRWCHDQQTYASCYMVASSIRNVEAACSVKAQDLCEKTWSSQYENSFFAYDGTGECCIIFKEKYTGT